MKQILTVTLAIFVSIFVGSLFMRVSTDVNDIPVMNEVKNIKAFQVGVYTDIENAKREAELKKGIVVQEDEYYYIYVSILGEQSNIDKMTNYLNENSIYYYIKDINVTDEFKNELFAIENMMFTTTSEVAFLQLNTKILESYGAMYES